MRDVKRIKPFLEKFGELWELKHYNMRFGQMICLLADEMKVNDIFYCEEDKLITAIASLIEKYKT